MAEMKLKEEFEEPEEQTLRSEILPMDQEMKEEAGCEDVHEAVPIVEQVKEEPEEVQIKQAWIEFIVSESCVKEEFVLHEAVKEEKTEDTDGAEAENSIKTEHTGDRRAERRTCFRSKSGKFVTKKKALQLQNVVKANRRRNTQGNAHTEEIQEAKPDTQPVLSAPLLTSVNVTADVTSLHPSQREMEPAQLLQTPNTEEKPYSCDQCGKGFTTSCYLKQHMVIHTEGHLKQHTRTHNGERPYDCDQCDKAFINSTHLRDHMRIHTGERPYECYFCYKTFTQTGHLRDHLRIHTGETPYICDECGKTFNLRSNLTQHKRTHNGLKPFTCDQCGKAFTLKGNLDLHVRGSHSGVRPYKCEQCGKTFASSSDQAKHMRTHTGEKPYVCDQCDKAFTQSCNLKAHMRIHTGEKPYKCEECGKTFGNQSDYSKHKKTHNGLKPYTCDQCGKAFSQAWSLKHHVRIGHNGERPYSCEQCGKTFTQATSLRYHMRVHTETHRDDECGKDSGSLREPTTDEIKCATSV